MARKLRVDTTVVETNIGVRVLARLMRRATSVAGDLGERVRSRLRSVRYRLIEAGRASRSRSKTDEQKRQRVYKKLLRTTGQVAAQAERIAEAAAKKRPKDSSKRKQLKTLSQQMQSAIGLVRQVMRQPKSRVFGGDVHVKE